MKMKENIIRKVVFAGAVLLVKHGLDGFSGHTDTVVSHADFQHFLSIHGIGRYGYRDGSCGSLRFDSVEQRVLNDWLEREAVDLTVVELVRFDVVVHGDASAVPVLLNQKIILDQIQLLPQCDHGGGSLGNIL